MLREDRHRKQITKGMPAAFAWAVPAAQEVSLKSNLDFEVMDQPHHAVMLRLVREAHHELLQNNQLETVNRWAFSETDSLTYSENQASHALQQLLFAMTCAGQAGIEPFASQPVTIHDEPEPDRDWSILPEQIVGLAEFAERFGHLQFEGDMIEFLESVSKQDWADLKRLAIFYNEHAELIDDFIDREDIQDRSEQYQIFFLPLLLDHAGLI